MFLQPCRWIERATQYATFAACLGVYGTTLAATLDGEQPKAKTFWNSHEEGWFWYQDPPPPATPQEEQQTATSPVPPNDDPVERLKAYTARVEAAKALAILEPTQAHIRDYLFIQKEALDRSTKFSDVAKFVVWQTPSLDYTIDHPTNNIANRIAKQQEQRAHAQAVSDAARKYGFFFFFKEDCPYCHAFAPIVQRFAQQNGIPVIAVSLDHGVIEGFDDLRFDQGEAAAMGITVVPSLYMANPYTKQTLAVTHGIIGDAELAERVYRLTTSESMSSLH